MWKLRSAVIERTPEHIYLGFGSNLGDRYAFFERALALLKSEDFIILRISDLYETEPWGGAQGGKYLNAVIELERKGTAQDLLSVTQKIETQLGRSHESRYAPRTCDLDILLWGSETINQPDLIIPHPKQAERRFVLRPLCDLIPDMLHPVMQKTFRILFATVCDNLEVEKTGS
ncbi:2-amino-4-hydroxy-6-hydroxymethyldihydropteridine diphosphokinase [bacterium]|nr:2-amino-4-hydroxy-6-hydroxymethyldihydropteridine diphosphokinase [bacterium]MBU1636589.1 2-amino-4-hydroxy-6-hydroxymethyldihydropteridine diphosphokinase [bacterium]MBU1919485.1 2-amino-4-hydroxy-6-hydroxymethyldihydropteridine diphosphokinase [bacterium]